MTSGAAARPHVGVVVVHHGDPTPTRRALEALASDPSPVDRTLALVDCGGLGEASPAWADRVIEAHDNPGFGAAANRAVDTFDAPVSTYLVLNHDVEVGTGFLAAAAAACQGGVGAAGGPLRLPDGTLWYAGGGVRRATGTVFQERDEAAASRPRDVGFVPGAALAVQPTAWRQVGGFDPWFFLYNEDLDLCLRLRRHGWRLRFDPGMAAVHRLGAATGSGDRSALYLEHLTRGRLRPFRPWAYRAYLAAIHSGWVALRAAIFLARGGGAAGPEVRALLRGHRAALGSLAMTKEASRPA